MTGDRFFIATKGFTRDQWNKLPTIPVAEQQFTNWVLAQPYAGNIGHRNNSCGCPLSKYLESLGYTYVNVDSTGIRLRDKDNTVQFYRHNDFTLSFINSLDDCAYRLPEIADFVPWNSVTLQTESNRNKYHGPVSRHEVLVILGVYPKSLGLG